MAEQTTFMRACLISSRLIKDHIRDSFRVDPQLLRHLDQLVLALQEHGDRLAKMLYGIEPEDMPHDYLAARDINNDSVCRTCGRPLDEHMTRQERVTKILGK